VSVWQAQGPEFKVQYCPKPETRNQKQKNKKERGLKDGRIEKLESDRRKEREREETEREREKETGKGGSKGHRWDGDGALLKVI
jgi:hypothetical protein